MLNGVELVKLNQKPTTVWFKTLPRQDHVASHRHSVTAKPLGFPHAGLLLPTVCPILKQTFILNYTSEHHLSSAKGGGNGRFLFWRQPFLSLLIMPFRSSLWSEKVLKSYKKMSSLFLFRLFHLLLCNCSLSLTPLVVLFLLLLLTDKLTVKKNEKWISGIGTPVPTFSLRGFLLDLGEGVVCWLVWVFWFGGVFLCLVWFVFCFM